MAKEGETKMDTIQKALVYGKKIKQQLAHGSIAPSDTGSCRAGSGMGCADAAAVG